MSGGGDEQFPWTPGQEARPFGAGRPLFGARPVPTTQPLPDGTELPFPPAPQAGPGRRAEGGGARWANTTLGGDDFEMPPGPETPTGRRNPRRTSPRSSNLRGSLGADGGEGPAVGATASTAAPAQTVTVALGRDPKVSLRKVPEKYAEYPNWRHTLLSKLPGSGIPVVESGYWGRLADHPYTRINETERYMRTVALVNLNGKIYSEIMDNLVGRNAIHATTIRLDVNTRGDGLSALLRLDQLMHFEGGVLLSRAYQDILSRGCDGMANLEEFATKTIDDLTTLEIRGQPMAPALLYEMLQRKLNPTDVNSRTHATASAFAFYEMMPESMRDPRAFLVTLQDLGRRYRLHQQTRRARGGYGADNKGGGGKDDKGKDGKRPKGGGGKDGGGEGPKKKTRSY